jgi:hypothetical protein
MLISIVSFFHFVIQPLFLFIFTHSIGTFSLSDYNFRDLPISVFANILTLIHFLKKLYSCSIHRTMKNTNYTASLFVLLLLQLQTSLLNV